MSDIKQRLLDESFKGQEAMRREALARIEALEAKIAAAREALKPFAQTGWMPSDAERDGLTVIAYIHADSRRELDLSSSDFFRAAAVLVSLGKATQ